MKYQFFTLNIENKIAQLAFNRPEKSNALHMPAWMEMQEIFEKLSESKEVRAIVLSGQGKNFSAGIDLELLMSVADYRKIECAGRRSEAIKDFIVKLQAAVNAIENCRKPVLAAVHGGCIGGGVDIIAACDMRYSTEEAYFTIKEIDLGMIADLGTLQRMPHLIPAGMLAEMAYTGRKVTGNEAKQMGLVNQTYFSKDELLESVNSIAARIASKSPLAIRGTKEVLQYSRDHSVSDSLDYIASLNASMLQSDDLKEAYQASIEKRKPDFRD